MKRVETLSGKNLPRLAVAKPGWPENQQARNMTREEFIDRYVKLSDMDLHKTPEGFTWGREGERGNVNLAMPCDCGEEGCEGWQMVSQEIHDSWIKLAGPDYYERQRQPSTITPQAVADFTRVCDQTGLTPKRGDNDTI